MTHPYFWTGEDIDHQARGGPTPNLHGHGSLRSGDGHTQHYYSAQAGSVKQTSGIREVDPAWGGATLAVGGFAVLVMLFACWACKIPQWLGAWMVTW